MIENQKQLEALGKAKMCLQKMDALPKFMQAGIVEPSHLILTPKQTIQKVLQIERRIYRIMLASIPFITFGTVFGMASIAMSIFESMKVAPFFAISIASLLIGGLLLAGGYGFAKTIGLFDLGDIRSLFKAHVFTPPKGTLIKHKNKFKKEVNYDYRTRH